MSEPLTLVVLAAGAGRRYGGFKQLAPVGPRGEALLEYSVHDALAEGFDRVVLVVSGDGEPSVRERLGESMAKAVTVAYAHQELDSLPAGFGVPEGRRKPWGTGHAVLAAEPEIRGPFAVINADDFYGRESFAALARFLSSPRVSSVPTLALVGFEVARTVSSSGPVSRALCRTDGEGLLREIKELPSVRQHEGRIVYQDGAQGQGVLSGTEAVSMNMWAFTPEVFAELRRGFVDFLGEADELGEREFLLPEVVQGWISEELFRVRVLPVGREWCGITFREDQERVAAILMDHIAAGRYPEVLWD